VTGVIEPGFDTTITHDGDVTWKNVSVPPCGNMDTPWLGAMPCVLPRGHRGVHRDETGCWWRK
jgi:hypothetical protein